MKSTCHHAASNFASQLDKGNPTVTTLHATAEIWMPGQPACTHLTLVVDAVDLSQNESTALEAAAVERWQREQTSDARALEISLRPPVATSQKVKRDDIIMVQ